MITIAVDGPAGAGKGTVANFLSKEFNLKHLDTGLLYREVARQSLLSGISLENAASLLDIAAAIDTDCLDENLLRNEEVAAASSKIAVFPEVRNILTLKMQEFVKNVASSYQGAVLDGRDVGIAVIPNADLKFFITADAEVRAQRRTKELLNKQNHAELNVVLKGLNERDQRDQSRKATPLQSATHAIIIDTTFLNIEQVCSKVSEVVKSRFKQFM
jgi:cytidylate kinase